MKKFLVISIAASLVLPCGPARAMDHPISYYPELSRSDIAVCRSQFEAIQADTVEFFQREAATEREGEYRQNLIKWGGEVAALNPVDLYYEGRTADGEGFGGVEYRNEKRAEAFGRYESEYHAAPVARDPSELDHSRWTQASVAEADRCVAKVYFSKYYAMHPEGAPAEFALAAKTGRAANAVSTRAVVQTCAKGPFMVFFDRDSDTVTPQAAAILDNAASVYASCQGSPVLLQGHTELAGSSEANIGLSQRRVSNVRSYLAGRGIPNGVITSEAFGESRPLVDTNDGVREPQNNRVEITYGPGPAFSGSIMEEPWNGVGKPPTSPAPSKKVGATSRSRGKPVPHLSDDQKVFNEMLRQQREGSSTQSEADARFAAEQLAYEQQLAVQQKAVADFEAAQQQMAADQAAAASRASAAQADFARQQAAYQAQQDQYARERAEYEAKLTGQPLEGDGGSATGGLSNSGSGGSSVPPLSPTTTLKAHNPANEASDCLELITKSDYERRGVSDIMGAVFRNRCPFPVETKWCIGADSCARGYDNIGTMPASNDRGISYDTPPPGVTVTTRWAGCRQGFEYRPDFAGTLHYACK